MKPLWMTLSPKPIKRLIPLFFFIVCIFSLVICCDQPTFAQIFPGLNPSDENLQPQSKIPVFYSGNLEVAPVFLDGREISTVVAFRSLSGGKSRNQEENYDASARSQVINSKSQKILFNMTRYANEVLSKQGIADLKAKERELSKQLVTNIANKEGTWVVSIAFPEDDVPEVVYSVTQATIAKPRFGGSQPEKIAQRTANMVHQSLIRAWRERQSPHLIAMSEQALLMLGGLVIISGALLGGQKAFVVREQRLNQLLANVTQVESMGIESPSSADEKAVTEKKERAEEFQRLQRNNIRQQISINSLGQSALFWSQWLIWFLGIGYVTSLFYFTRPLSNWIMGVSIRNAWSQTSQPGLPLIDWLLSFGQKANLGTPLFILMLFLITRLIIKIGDALSVSFAQVWLKNPSAQRRSLRINTLAGVFQGWFRVIVYMVLGGMVTYHLHQLGAITQVVAVLLGFLSFALSLASQDLLKDLIGGLLILWEDQYTVGDVIIVGGQGGLVEKITLRVTQLRNLDGELITIPNRTIEMVRNLSSEWSRVNYAIEVSYDADIDQVLQVMNRIGQELYHHQEWQDKILEPPEILGIDEMSHKGILIRLIIKTQPLEQWSVAREFRLRLKNAFDQQGIIVGIPQQKIYLHDTISNGYQPDFPLANLTKE